MNVCFYVMITPLQRHKCLNEWSQLLFLLRDKAFMKCRMFQMHHACEKYTTCVWNDLIFLLFKKNIRYYSVIQLLIPRLTLCFYSCTLQDSLVQPDFHVKILGPLIQDILDWWNELLRLRQGLMADFSFGKSRRAFCVVTSITVCSDTPLILLMYSALMQMFLGSFLTCNTAGRMQHEF